MGDDTLYPEKSVRSETDSKYVPSSDFGDSRKIIIENAVAVATLDAQFAAKIEAAMKELNSLVWAAIRNGLEVNVSLDSVYHPSVAVKLSRRIY